MSRSVAVTATVTAMVRRTQPPPGPSRTMFAGDMFEAINWPDDMSPSRSPIHFTNELEVKVSQETIWSLLTDPQAWPSFYPGVEHVQLLDSHDAFRLGTRFETNLAGQDGYASVQEFEPLTRIAWGGGPKAAPESRAYHAWIITPTSHGTHLWTEKRCRARSGLIWPSRRPKGFGARTRGCSRISARSPLNANAAEAAHIERVASSFHQLQSFESETEVTYAIIGFGAVGQALAMAFARKGIEVAVASRRPPEALTQQAAAIGPTVTPEPLVKAIEADTILLAVPFWEHREVAKATSSWEGKTVIDVTNAFGVPVEDLDDLPSSAVVARAFSGAKLVKAFNHLAAARLAADPDVGGGRRVIFVSSDDEDATASVEALVERLGFAAVKLGRLAEGGALVQARGRSWAPLIFQDLVKMTSK